MKFIKGWNSEQQQEACVQNVKELLQNEIPEGTFSRDQIINDFINNLCKEFLLVRKVKSNAGK